MGRILLVLRLAARDVRRHPAQAALLVATITAATATLTLGLVLHGVVQTPYKSTRAATAGPDVVARVAPPEPGPNGTPVGGSHASVNPAALNALTRARGVVAHSGPYTLADTTLTAHGTRAAVQAEGRDVAPATLDQPELTAGRWVRDGGVVVERAFADAFDVHTGDAVKVGGRSFRVTGIAVTAAMSPYPSAGSMVDGHVVHPGLVWLTRADARRLAVAQENVSYIMNLRLADPARAPAFVTAHEPSENESLNLNAPPGARPAVPPPPPPMLQSWTQLSDNAGNLVRNERRALLTGSWLLGLLALASVAVLVGGRMAGQLRRVGLLKAVGGTPGLVASVLLAEYVVLALVAAAAGLAIGRLTAPPLADPGAGLVGGAGGIPFGVVDVLVVIAVAVAVAVVATLVPAVRAARVSTVLALGDAARPPRRSARLIALSARLPVPLLLGLRVAGRRPRRSLLCAAGATITVAGIVAVLSAHAQLDAQRTTSALADPRTDRLSDVLALIAVMLVAQAAVNAVFITWATVLDARRTSALARALGATPGQVAAGLSAAQVLPALAGAIAGIPAGLGLFAAVSPDDAPTPSAWWLLATVAGTVVVVTALTAIPARASARQPVAAVLRSELA
ncbi:MAG TPA: FtsX-like permease family protein [Baekduia sp.]|uniref:FtsX-like permease family protein n=1 Tax=Baekduia sp. TaxID=2600305 RepID=UPI002C9190FE|nr:FtsX-like permease family protein [Baekduia sp.]HMJ35365.1 FtsX-like permease family protein [Baekduia sp.]